MACVGQVRPKTLRIGKNSKREIAIDYARGISRPVNERGMQESVQVQNMEDLDGYSNEKDYSYQSPEYNLSQLDENHNNFASELEKIKSMFN